MKVYVVMWGSCEPGGYNLDEGIISIHLDAQRAEAVVIEYESDQDDTELDWAYVKEWEVEEE